MFRYLSPVEAQEILRRYDYDPMRLRKVPEEYKDLSKRILEVYDSKDDKYVRDYKVGVAIYSYFQNHPKFTLREASNVEFWIYIQVHVIPQIVDNRWGLQNADHVYKIKRRVWLSNLWWYIHLCWQGDVTSTLNVVRNLNTDVILNLVERSGGGYNVDLSRCIMRKYSEATNRNIFRKLMILNTSYSQTVIPDYFNGGLNGYVEFLFKELRG